jgi:transposase-like protein
MSYEIKPTCPHCKSLYVEHIEKRDDNGICGSGYSSWVVFEYWICKDCGVMFQKV